MIGSDIYLVGKEMENGQYIEKACSCTMCKRLIINSGIEKVIIRDDRENYRVIEVSDWVLSDDSLTGEMGY
jgi:dCMP deaminase